MYNVKVNDNVNVNNNDDDNDNDDADLEPSSRDHYLTCVDHISCTYVCPYIHSNVITYKLCGKSIFAKLCKNLHECSIIFL